MTTTTTDYELESAEDPQVLVYKVREKIHEGWEPLCGVSVAVAIGRTSYTQAMVCTQNIRYHGVQ